MEDVASKPHEPGLARLAANAASRIAHPALPGIPAGGPAQRRARLLTAMLVTLILLALAALVLVVVVNPAGSPRRDEYGVLIGAVLLLLVAALALNLAARCELAAALTVGCALLAPWGAALLDPRVQHGDFVPLTYVVVPILLSGILLSARVTAVVSAAQVAALLLFASLAAIAAPINWPSLCTVVVFVAVLSIVATLMNAKDLEQILCQNRQLEESEARLREQSVRDHVSGLFNRRYLEETLERELNRAARTQTGLGIIMLDLDRFKELNDRYGHSAGDEVLRRLGELLNSSLRFADIACRYGGDEFVLSCPRLHGRWHRSAPRSCAGMPAHSSCRSWAGRCPPFRCRWAFRSSPKTAPRPQPCWRPATSRSIEPRPPAETASRRRTPASTEPSLASGQRLTLTLGKGAQ